MIANPSVLSIAVHARLCGGAPPTAPWRLACPAAAAEGYLWDEMALRREKQRPLIVLLAHGASKRKLHAGSKLCAAEARRMALNRVSPDIHAAALLIAWREAVGEHAKPTNVVA